MPNDDSKYNKVSYFDPERCNGITAHGQCLIRRLPGLKWCQAHARRALKAQENARIRLYNLALVNAQRVNEFKGHDEWKSFNNEIGLIRLLIEQKVNACQTSNQLIMASQSISNLVNTVANLVNSAAKLEQHSSSTLNKAQVDAFASNIIGILTKHVSPEILEKIVQEVEVAKNVNTEQR